MKACHDMQLLQTSEKIFSPVSITYFKYPRCPEHAGLVLDMIILPSPSLFVRESNISAKARKLDKVLTSSPHSAVPVGAKLFCKVTSLSPYALTWKTEYMTILKNAERAGKKNEVAPGNKRMTIRRIHLVHDVAVV